MTKRKFFLFDWWRRLLKTSALALLLITLSLGLSGAWWDANNNSQLARKSNLAQGDAITDPIAILRSALPIENETVRQLQEDLEDISKHLRGKRWQPIVRDVKDASLILTLRSDKILASVSPENKPAAEALLLQMNTGINELKEAVEVQDKEQVYLKRRELLNLITDIEELMVKEFPFAVPKEYANLPQLLGRATVEMETTKGKLTIVVDGYSAPVNGGNFVDLVQRGFYDGLEFIRAEDNYVLQSGDPPGAEAGFIDPNTGEYRSIPLEVLVKGESAPIYGITLEDAGIYLPELALPFNAYGAVALASPGNDPNGGSSQFFFFKFDRELTPPGFNLMDGRYSVFGYLVEGKEVLEELTAQDKIISAKVVDGIDNLLQPEGLATKTLPQEPTEQVGEPEVPSL
ncbi:MAG: peptidylprolyl isomerase [Gomphosphaeria aponina SAG 52.96 = DSM 107014]|uniref:peptidylprolyl isomerase n=1 Tax=Gomphosphaeria aponina SAG 52.96 = DSM 107014 TaxID=1521640 RepID=A0A941JTQ8_9CHRO|nr:peptidylprolyl isomerase [Gomphosphaeria aponina SAG 52.96 = DSM 107014]